MVLRRPVLLALVGVLALGTAGCSGKDSAAQSSTNPPDVSNGVATDPSAPAVAAPSGSQCYSLQISDAWVRATQTGKKMTGAFATIKNTGSAQVTIASATAARAGKVELHETSNGTMAAKAGGFVIEPGATLKLEPGKDHVMLMELDGELLAGENVPVVLKCGDGSSTPMQGEVRTYAGAQDTYHDGSTTAPAATTPAAPGAPSTPAAVTVSGTTVAIPGEAPAAG